MGFSEPFENFANWFAEADKKEPELANAVAIATVGSDGAPSQRMVLLKDWSEDGFVFYTNLTSRKASEMAENPQIAMLFHWKSIDRQIRIEGEAIAVSYAEADEYFASRHRDSQIGAWASDQSSVMEGRFSLEKAVAKYAAKFHVGTVPRPPHWSGFRVKPKRFEFWRGKAFRLHERKIFTLNDEGDNWVQTFLYP
ncbi:MAG: pyridoxamine 5'-phosphate oxidase [Sphingomonadales bacterium]|nr:pyridoxamine 5'-phosphate oxidase [Sphingomonadales bacterium]